MLTVNVVIVRLRALISRTRASRANDAVFKIRAYNSAIEKLRTLDGDFTEKKLDTLTLTSHMRAQILTLAAMIDDLKPAIAIPTATIPPQWLLDVDGIGVVRAQELWKIGVRLPIDLTKKSIFATLPRETQISLRFPPLRKIPFALVRAFETNFRAKFGANFAITGSYRREAATSGDIDVLVFGDVSENIRASKILQTEFSLREFAHGDDKFAGIITLGSPARTVGPVYAHIDVFHAHENERAAQLLYATGSRAHNIHLRARAKKHGMLLNQHGLFRKDARSEAGARSGALVRIPTITEADIYAQLGLDYVAPRDRV